MTVTLPRILISDDDFEFRETLCGVFEPEGLRTLTADDGHQAVDMVRRFEVHVVLLDIHMPKLTGLEVLRLVQEEQFQAPCILMSAHLDDDLIEQANQLRAFSVLAKSAGCQSFKAIVTRALRDFYGWQGDRSA